jgi:UDP-N-acetylmuramoylalanine--D-glutamate ligase
LEKLKINTREDLYNNIEWEEGHTEDLILNATVVMKSPGIPDKASICWLKKKELR